MDMTVTWCDILKVEEESAINLCLTQVMTLRYGDIMKAVISNYDKHGCKCLELLYQVHCPALVFASFQFSRGGGEEI